MDTINLLTIILTVVLTAMFILLVVLAIIYTKSRNKKEKNIDINNIGKNKKGSKTKKYREHTTDSIMNFMNFDTVVDNMISQKDGKRYVMVVECQGINYDLMSEMEKNSVEEGFIQFLNTLRHPIQIYTQTRTINLEDSIQTYKTKMNEIEEELQKQEMNYKQMLKEGTYPKQQMDAVYYELTKQRNLYEYGKDIIFTTERMSSNKNVLNQKYYVVIPYYLEELGDVNGNFDKEEQRNMAFSELYTRAQSVIRTLSACGVNGKILTSNGLVELLYMAYNRDEADVYGIDKALKAGYDELYSTAPDVVDKQMKLLDEQIEAEAIELAKSKVLEARSEKQKALKEKQSNKKNLIDELAALIIEENSQIVGEDLAEKAIEKLKTNEDEKGGDDTNEVKEKAKRRIRKTKTA